MILYKNEYYNFIQSRGVGSRDRVASSRDSYISYLNTVSKLIGKDITPAVLSSEDDILRIERMIEGQRSRKTIGNFKSAMRQYVAMINSEDLRK